MSCVYMYSKLCLVECSVYNRHLTFWYNQEGNKAFIYDNDINNLKEARILPSETLNKMFRKSYDKIIYNVIFCHLAQYWVPKMLSVNTCSFKGSLIQISKLNRAHHKVPRRWYINHISVTKSGSRFCFKDITYYKIVLTRTIPISKKENLTLQAEPPLPCSTVFLTDCYAWVSLCWFNSLLKRGLSWITVFWVSSWTGASPLL